MNLHKWTVDQYSLIYIQRGSEEGGVTYWHLHSALLLLGKGHFACQELSMESKATRGGKSLLLDVEEEMDGQYVYNHCCNYNLMSTELNRHSAKQKVTRVLPLVCTQVLILDECLESPGNCMFSYSIMHTKRLIFNRCLLNIKTKIQ